MRLAILAFILTASNYIAAKAQSIEVSYLTGASTSLYAQNRQIFSNILELKSRILPFPNAVGEASVSYYFHKEKYKVSLAYNQLVYYYNFKTGVIYPDFFAKDETVQVSTGINNHAISVNFGPNIQVKPKIFFQPFIAIYMTLGKGTSTVGTGQDIPIPNADTTISMGHLVFQDQASFKPSIILGIGYKFNFFVNKWLFFTVGSRYTRGFRKDFTATLSMDIDGQHYETQKFMRSSNFSIDLGLGAKFNLKKKPK